ncbi:uncharacterized protein PRCAT00006011001 [Priceomyces carsonii]|uniref:uncharacterized protein n=1 Tax=Priceomyces carsonii TaxID=28549 RepID=UPI002ED8335A|nr:unnamed protein product [Priceomyces carsonii]
MSFDAYTDGNKPYGNNYFDRTATEYSLPFDEFEIGSGLELNQQNVDALNDAVNLRNFESNIKSDGTISSSSDPNKIFEGHEYSAGSSPSRTLGSQKSGLSPSVNSTLPDASEKKAPLNLKGKLKKQYLDEQDAKLIARDDSELTEEELAMKRKAQNRAAQRAFRERKETKLREYEDRLLKSEEEKQNLINQLDLIRQQNISILMENELLKLSGSDGNNSTRLEGLDKFLFPQSQSEFINKYADYHEVNPDTVNKIYDSPENPSEKVLTIGALWDYLQLKAEEKEALDVADVMAKLKGNEKCHGYGPAYSFNLINHIINESSSMG